MSETLKQRIDKWLFFARIVKSRTLAAKLAEGGKVRINKEKTSSSSQKVKIDDVLTITLDRKILVLRIAQLGARRGPFSEAQTLYEDLSPPPVVKDKETSNNIDIKPHIPYREPGSGRPTKRERRKIDKLRAPDY